MSEKKPVPSPAQQAATIPFFVHEAAMARMERINRYWFIAFLVAVAILFVTNAAWIVYEAQYSTYAVEQAVDTGAGDAYVTGIGDVSYGESAPANYRPREENQQQKPLENLPGL